MAKKQREEQTNITIDNGWLYVIAIGLCLLMTTPLITEIRKDNNTIDAGDCIKLNKEDEYNCIKTYIEIDQTKRKMEIIQSLEYKQLKELIEELK